LVLVVNSHFPVTALGLDLFSGAYLNKSLSLSCPVVYKFATQNINGLAQRTRIRMLENFLWKHDVYIALLQDVTSSQIDTIRRYTKYTHTGTEQRVTAIIVKDGLTLTNVRRLPSGRGMAGTFNGTCIGNVCAPSGAEWKHERETFYNTDLPYLLPTAQSEFILAGDFNCVLLQSDITGRKTLVEPSKT